MLRILLDLLDPYAYRLQDHFSPVAHAHGGSLGSKGLAGARIMGGSPCSSGGFLHLRHVETLS
jgi:hypothetical protein